MFRGRRTAPFKYDEAYRMRYNPTPAEARMWEILRFDVMPKFPNHIFRRQQVRYGELHCRVVDDLYAEREHDAWVGNQDAGQDRV